MITTYTPVNLVRLIMTLSYVEVVEDRNLKYLISMTIIHHAGLFRNYRMVLGYYNK